MNRTTSRTQLGPSHVRYRSRLEMDPNPDSDKGLIEVLNLLAQNPMWMNCQYNSPQKLSIWHNGTTWVVDTEAIVDG